jgi:ABC-type sugar transport system ATPase subunit
VTAALQASGLGKRYRRIWALRDCNLTVPRGRIAALVGPNGASKTTLLHLAVGLLAPTTGSIRVLDQPPADPGLLAEVGFVAQDTPLYRDFTAAEHLTLGAKLNRRFARPWPEAGWSGLSSRWTAGLAPCPAGSAPRSPWRWPWPNGRSCCCWTSRWPAWTRWPAANSSRL